MVSSWLGGAVLADDVPVLRGKVTWTVGQEVQSDVKLTVAATSVENGRTRRWRPSTPLAPLARYGQVLDISVLVEGVLVRLGRFQITDWKDGANGQIEVSAAGMLQPVSDDMLVESLGPRDDGTLRSEFARLTPAYMSAQFAPALADRACPKTMEWDKDRLKALYEIADAWPARLREDSWGGIVVLPPLPEVPVPVITLTDGADGTIIGAPTSDSREGSYNVFVARSSADGVDAFAVVTVNGGPMDPSGDYLPVPKFFSSPLLLNEDQCRAAATTMRDNSVRQSRIRQVELVPDPRLELDDAVELYIDRGTELEAREWGYIIGVEMPLTVNDGAMRIDVAAF
ncbi:hypothetical protein MicroSTF_14525 [Microbacterium sp. STF-2]|uniref:hypothetical protein n=1 Tax=Microbacterium sp. STF-2 TaxID=3031132 RepID=UPI002AFF12ED|nr:hypothetical protein [Microbacterium sp. STF-2]MEA1264255.1 hypothetical protein [Microbacterium sp. STF-2]